MRVIVYGTLRKDGVAFNQLKSINAEYLGSFQSPPEYTLYDNRGSFPCLVKGGNTSITMEVYNTTYSNIQDKLDSYEGVESGLYKREIMDSPFGKSFVYIFNRSVKNMNIISNGDWIEYKKNNIIKNLCQL